MRIKITELNEDIFSTSDLALAAILSIWFPLQKVDKRNPRRALFVFHRSKKLDNLLKKYWEKKLAIEPRQYFDQLKSLKARLYSNE